MPLKPSARLAVVIYAKTERGSFFRLSGDGGCITNGKKQKARPKGVREREKVVRGNRLSVLTTVCVLLKRKKAESEAQRGKPKGTLESESRNAIVE